MPGDQANFMGSMLVIATLLALVALAGEAQASHYRFGTLDWEPTGATNEAEFNARVAFRWTFFGGPAVGTVHNVGSLATGDGTLYPFRIQVTAIHAADDWFEAILVDGASNPGITHAYPSPDDGGSPWEASWTSNGWFTAQAGLYTHVNNAGVSWRLETLVDLSPANASPKSGHDFIIDCPAEGLCVFPIAAMDPDGDPLTYRFATSVEATGGGGFDQPGPPHAPFAAVVNAVTGEVAWNTTDLHCDPDVDLFYSIAVMIEDGRTKTPLQFLIRIGCLPLPDFEWEIGNKCLGMIFKDLSPAPPAPFHIAEWRWDFGDGSPPVSYSPPPPSSVSHQYGAPGTYDVTLTISYEHNATHSINATRSTTKSVAVGGCPLTWGSGDQFGKYLVAVEGIGTGCGTGWAPDSTTNSVPGTQVLALDVSLLPMLPPTPSPTFGRISVFPDLPVNKALHVSATIGTGDSERLYVIGGTGDGCLPLTPQESTHYLSHGPTGPFWSAGPDLNVGRIAPAVAHGISTGEIRVYGGDAVGNPYLAPDAHRNFRPTASVERSVNGGPWVELEPMPAGVTGAGVTNGAFGALVTGGASHPEAISTLVQEFANGTWLGDHLPEYRAAHEALFCGGDVYVIGGVLGETREMYSDAGATASVVKDLGTWSAAPALPAPRSHLAGTVVRPGLEAVFGAEMVLIGGYDGFGGIADTIYRLDCGGGAAWTASTLPAGLERAEHGVEAVGGVPAVVDALLNPAPIPDLPPRIFVFGGVSPATAPCPTDDVYALGGTPLAPLLPPIPPIPGGPVASMGTAVLSDGTIVLVGGRVAGLTDGGVFSCHIPSKQVWLFDPVTHAWAAAPGLPEGLIAPAVEVIEDRVYVTAGDETGDKPLPYFPQACPTCTLSDILVDPKRRPNMHTYSLEFTPAVGGPATPKSTQWLEDEGIPMGVVSARAVFDGERLHVIGGHHHPVASTRLVQSFKQDGLAEKEVGRFLSSLPLVGPDPPPDTTGTWGEFRGRTGNGGIAHHTYMWCSAGPVANGGIFNRGPAFPRGVLYHTHRDNQAGFRTFGVTTNRLGVSTLGVVFTGTTFDDFRTLDYDVIDGCNGGFAAPGAADVPLLPGWGLLALPGGIAAVGTGRMRWRPPS